MEIEKFIYNYLQSPSFIDLFNQNKTGIIGGVSIAKVKDIIIPGIFPYPAVARITGSRSIPFCTEKVTIES